MFESRQQAGELLAHKLKELGYGGKNTIVLAIPRGGVVTGRVVADRLLCPLDVVITRKIPAPNQPELALGAVGPEGTRVFDVGLVERTGATEEYLKNKIEELKKEIKEREKKFRHERGPLLNLIKDKTVILVDDGIATGATIEAAIRFLKTKGPKKIVLSSPVASRDSAETLQTLVDQVVVLNIPDEFQAVGQFYKDFQQVSDEEVIRLLGGMFP